MLLSFVRSRRASHLAAKCAEHAEAAQNAKAHPPGGGERDKRANRFDRVDLRDLVMA